MKIVLIGLRVAQFIFSVVVLGLSVALIKGQLWGKAPATTGFDAFAGGLGIVASIFGIICNFVPSLNGIISWAFDGVAALAFLAAGIATSVGLRGTDCGKISEALIKNELLNGGWIKSKNGDGPALYPKDIMNRCKMDKGDVAFMFLACVATAAALAMSFIGGSKRNVGGNYVI